MLSNTWWCNIICQCSNSLAKFVILEKPNPRWTNFWCLPSAHYAYNVIVLALVFFLPLTLRYRVLGLGLDTWSTFKDVGLSCISYFSTVDGCRSWLAYCTFRELQAEVSVNNTKRQTGCPSFGICTTVCFDGVTLICLSHNFNLSKFAIAKIDIHFTFATMMGKKPQTCKATADAACLTVVCGEKTKMVCSAWSVQLIATSVRECNDLVCSTVVGLLDVSMPIAAILYLSLSTVPCMRSSPKQSSTVVVRPLTWMHIDNAPAAGWPKMTIKDNLSLR